MFSSVLFDIAICFDFLLVNLLVTREPRHPALRNGYARFYFHHVNVLFFCVVPGRVELPTSTLSV